MIGYKVTYECVEDSESWGRLGSRVTIIFGEYDVNNFQRYAPSTWQIRIIAEIE